MEKMKREVSIELSHLMTVDDPMDFIAHVLKENLEILRDEMTRQFSYNIDHFEITIPSRFASVVMADRIEFFKAIKYRLKMSWRLNEKIIYKLIHNAGDIIRIEAVGYICLRPSDSLLKYCNEDVYQTFNIYERMKMEEERFVRNKLQIKEVKFNSPATIVFWTDGTKTVVKCQEGETFDPEKGIAMAIVKKAYGNEGNYYEKIKKALNESTGREIK